MHWNIFWKAEFFKPVGNKTCNNKNKPGFGCLRMSAILFKLNKITKYCCQVIQSRTSRVVWKFWKTIDEKCLCCQICSEIKIYQNFRKFSFKFFHKLWKPWIKWPLNQLTWPQNVLEKKYSNGFILRDYLVLVEHSQTIVINNHIAVLFKN